MVNHLKKKLAPGLYLVATPLGTARDITLRALDILANADLIAAEDTRSLRKLLEIHGVPLEGRQVLPYHDHNGGQMRPRLLAALAEGKSVVYASEAGTPMIADPGFDLARAAMQAGAELVSAPGPSAVITALTLAGLPSDRFLFAGFLPNAGGRRKTQLEELREVPATLVFYESPKRIAAMLAAAAKVMGDRQAAICREMTKKFEEVLRGSLPELAQICAERPLKGEIVVVIDRGHKSNVSEIEIDRKLDEALQTRTVRDASDLVAAVLGLPRRQIYQRALARKAET